MRKCVIIHCDVQSNVFSGRKEVKKMKVYCDSAGLLEVALYGVAKITKSSAETIKRIISGKPVLMATANRIFKSLGKDPRLKIWHDKPKMI